MYDVQHCRRMGPEHKKWVLHSTELHLDIALSTILDIADKVEFDSHIFRIVGPGRDEDGNQSDDIVLYELTVIGNNIAIRHPINQV